MCLSLCMIVRNEEHSLPRSLGPIHHAFADVLVLDDNSSDNTVTLLKDSWGIDPMPGGPRAGRCKADLRNALLARVRTPWVVTLDADEQLPADTITRLMATLPQYTGDGLFLGWDTHLHGTVVVDYKLAVFRSDSRYQGLAHETVQPWFRSHSRHADWSDLARIEHRPQTRRLPAKRRLYRQRLHQALEEQPGWSRYHWFLGLSQYHEGATAAAAAHLAAAAAGHASFPVEALNAHMLLVVLRHGEGDLPGARRWAETGLGLWHQLQGDFEVRVNTAVQPWLQAASSALASGGPLPAMPAFAY